MTVVNVNKRRVKNRPEQTLQQQLAGFLDKALPRGAFWFHVPNSARRGWQEGKALKAMGVKAGAPDVVIFWNRRAFCLELKAKYGVVSDDQRNVHAQLQDAGIPIETVRSLKEAQVRLLEFGIPLRAEIAA